MLCLQLLVFLVPIAMSNLTALGMGSFTYDVFDTVKIFILRAILIVAAAVWVWVFLGGGGTLRRTRFDWLVIIILAWTGVTTLTSLRPAESFLGRYGRYEGLSTLLFYGVLFFLVVQIVTTAERRKSIARAAAFSAVVVSAYAIAQALGHDPFLWGGLPFSDRLAFSTIGNPDMLGGYLVAPLVLNLALAWDESDVRWKVFHWAAEILILAGLFAAFARGPWVGAAIALVCFAAVLLRQRRAPSFVDALAMAAAGALAFGAGFLSSRSPAPERNILGRLSGLLHPHAGSVGTRLETWRVTVNAIAHRPVQGYGPDTFRLMLARFKDAKYVDANGYSVVADNAHDYPLQLGSTMGVPGLLASYGLFAGVLFQAGRRILSSSSRGAYRSLLLAGYWSAAVGYLAYLFFGISLVGSTSLFWLSLGVLAAPAARTSLLTPATWRKWLAYAGCTVLCLAFVANVLFLEADYYYVKADQVMGTERAVQYMQTASRLNPLSADYKQGIALAEYSRYIPLAQQLHTEMIQGTVSNGLPERVKSSMYATSSAWEDAISASPFRIRELCASLGNIQLLLFFRSELCGEIGSVG